jgi:uncharacterized membrane protein
MLSTIAGSMMSVVGVTFSMTLVALAMASSQYSSRIVRNFMRSRVTQTVLGLFAGIFTYCLIVLRTIRSGDEGEFVPSLAVFVGVVLAVCGVGLLIFFIHHIASSIQASNIIASVCEETLAAVDRLFPEKLGDAAPEGAKRQSEPPELGGGWLAVGAPRTGYIQNVDNAGLLRLAARFNGVLRMEKGIGDFLVAETPLISVNPRQTLEPEMIGELQDVFEINQFRTVEQDAAFGIRQMVDVALKALSPGINDTTTAVTCVNYLSAILSRLASREMPPTHRFDEGRLRVIAKAPEFGALLGECLDEIRGSAGGNITVMLQMLACLRTVAGFTTDPARLRHLREHLNLVEELAKNTVKSPHDLAKIQAAADELSAILRDDRRKIEPATMLST